VRIKENGRRTEVYVRFRRHSYIGGGLEKGFQGRRNVVLFLVSYIEVGSLSNHGPELLFLVFPTKKFSFSFFLAYADLGSKDKRLEVTYACR
jgi:hypothetical protein